MSAARVVPVCRYYRHILCEYVDDTMYTTVIMNLPCQTILLTHLNLSIYVLGGSHAPWMVHWRFENKTGNRRGHAIHPRVTIYCSACCEAELDHHIVVHLSNQALSKQGYRALNRCTIPLQNTFTAVSN